MFQLSRTRCIATTMHRAHRCGLGTGRARLQLSTSDVDLLPIGRKPSLGVFAFRSGAALLQSRNLSDGIPNPRAQRIHCGLHSRTERSWLGERRPRRPSRRRERRDLGDAPRRSVRRPHRLVVERHPNDKAEPRRHNHHVHELRAVLASVSTVPRKVMYFDRMALFLNVDAHIPIDGRHHKAPKITPLPQRT